MRLSEELARILGVPPGRRGRRPERGPRDVVPSERPARPDGRDPFEARDGLKSEIPPPEERR